MTTLNGPRLAPKGGRPASGLVVLLHGYGADGDNLMVVAVKFGSRAEKLGIEQSFRITALEVPADRPAKEWFFLPAFFLLGVIILIQRGRARRQRQEDDARRDHVHQGLQGAPRGDSGEPRPIRIGD